jgi:cytochrome c-type biogenesis protein CcmH
VSRARATALLAAVLLGLAAPSVLLAAPVTDEAINAVASQLRCVVCQNLSVADSPSEMARQMRDLIKERLAQGETPEQVILYFEQRYGDWVLLTPRPRGFNLLVWIAPFAAVLLGLLAVLRVTRRWSRRTAPGPVGPPADAITSEERQRLRGELERLRD